MSGCNVRGRGPGWLDVGGSGVAVGYIWTPFILLVDCDGYPVPCFELGSIGFWPFLRLWFYNCRVSFCLYF